MRRFLIIPLLLVCSQAFAADCHETGCYYYLGPWVQVERSGVMFWDAPAGTVGRKDLRSLPEKDSAGIGFFASTMELGAGYTLIHEGDAVEDDATDAMRDAWEAETGYRPAGEKVIDLLWSQLTDGADPTGQAAVKPLMPTTDGKLNLHLGGHSLVKSEKFTYGKHPHTAKVRDVLRNTYRALRKEQRTQGRETYRKTLDYWGKKYGVRNPETEFIPDDLPKEKPLKHETTISDNFNRTDADALGTSGEGWIWSEQGPNYDLVSNQAKVTTNAGGFARAESDLSGDDHYAQVDVENRGTATNKVLGVMVRANTAVFASSSHYWAEYNAIAGQWLIQKRVSGSNTTLATLTSSAPSVPHTVKLEVDGSDLTLYLNGASILTDNDPDITGNIRTGLRTFDASNGIYDDFQASDLAVGGGGWTGKVSGVSSPAKVNGVANADIAKVSGVA